jgi:RNA polymerase sigma-70 factor (ECF subfamily)
VVTWTLKGKMGGFTADEVITVGDEDLLRQACQGQIEAFDKLVLRYERLLLSIAYGILLNWYDAQDATQLALMRTYQSLQNIHADKPGTVRSYLTKAVKNAAIDIARKRHEVSLDAVTEIYPLDSPTPEPLVGLISSEERRALIECIKNLPPKHRVVIVLRFIKLLSLEEVDVILTELGWPSGAIQNVFNNEADRIVDILEHTKPMGVKTVGGVGNILKAARLSVKKCFEQKIS